MQGQLVQVQTALQETPVTLETPVTQVTQGITVLRVTAAPVA